jgi:hypothetical protein
VKAHTLSLTLAFIIPILFMLAMPYAAGDLFIWIKLGNFILSSGAILRHDIFSVLPTTEMVYPSWGASVLYSFLYRFIGILGVCIFHAVVVLPILLFILYRPLIKSGYLPSEKSAKWVLFLFWLGGVPTFCERPAMLALIPLVLSFQIIARLPKHETRLADAAKLILIEIIWANLHGSFVLLPIMLIWKSFWSFRFDLKRVALVWASFFAAGLNPFGFKVYPYLFETARLSKERGITEWDFPWLTTQFPTGLLFWLLFIYVIYFLRKRYQAGSLFQTIANPFFLFMLLGMLSIRNAALAFVVLIPGAYAANFFSAEKAPDSRARPLNLAIAMLALLAIPLVATYKPKKWDNDTAFALADLIRKDGRNCPVFSDWELAGFLSLEVPNQTYLDTRNIIFSREEFHWYEQTLNGEPIWKKFIDAGKTCFIVVTPEKSAGLIAKLAASPEWEKSATEGTHVLYTRKRN